jgi:hypothetical protein
MGLIAGGWAWGYSGMEMNREGAKSAKEERGGEGEELSADFADDTD